MICINIDSSTDLSDLREFHRKLAAGVAVAEVRLGYPEESDAVGAVRYGALLQAILSWAHLAEDSRLILPEGWLGDVSGGVITSDLHLSALVLANHVNGVARGEYGEFVSSCISRSLSNKRFLNPLEATASARARSILLVSHSPNFHWSPDLQLVRNGVPEIEESARSLFSDIWRTNDDARTLRPPSLQEDEVSLPVGDRFPTHVARKKWPETHPLRDTDANFVPLVKRALHPRGVAQRIYADRLNRPEDSISGLGSVLFELVQNTQWHASGPEKAAGVEGCRFFRFSEERITRYDNDTLATRHAGFSSYVASALAVPEEAGFIKASAVTLATISIIDHGIGLAGSAAAALGESHLLTPATEIAYLRMALAKGIKVSRSSMGNIGLPRVQQLLSNLDGFMLIRTGSSQVYRNFCTDPFGTTAGRQTPKRQGQFVDWIPTGPDEFDVGPRIGTDVTIALPVDYEFEA